MLLDPRNGPSFQYFLSESKYRNEASLVLSVSLQPISSSVVVELFAFMTACLLHRYVYWRYTGILSNVSYCSVYNPTQLASSPPACLRTLAGAWTATMPHAAQQRTVGQRTICANERSCDRVMRHLSSEGGRRARQSGRRRRSPQRRHQPAARYRLPWQLMIRTSGGVATAESAAALRQSKARPLTSRCKQPSDNTRSTHVASLSFNARLKMCPRRLREWARAGCLPW
jgi:hypothetical protein